MVKQQLVRNKLISEISQNKQVKMETLLFGWVRRIKNYVSGRHRLTELAALAKKFVKPLH